MSVVVFFSKAMTAEESWAWGAFIDLYGVNIFFGHSIRENFLLIHLGKCFKQMNSLPKPLGYHKYQLWPENCNGTNCRFLKREQVFVIIINTALNIFHSLLCWFFSFPGSNPISQKSSSFSVSFMSTLSIRKLGTYTIQHMLILANISIESSVL